MLKHLGKVVLFACLCTSHLYAYSNQLSEYEVYEADVDNDGDIDYLLKLAPEKIEIPYDINLQIERSAQQYLLRHNSDGLFTVELTNQNGSDQWVIIDANIDEINYLAGGELEIAIRTYGADPQVMIFAQNGQGDLIFGDAIKAQTINNGATASILDVNNDGLEDVLISGNEINTISSGNASLKHDAVQNFAPKTWAGQDGASHAAIDIFMPKELGPAPSLSIQYSSNSGNGLLGMGFNLSGVSKIHYCRPLADVDDTMAARAFSSSERLCIDGQHLVQTRGTSRFAHDATYMTEITNHSRIRYKNVSSENKFVVETKGGGKLIYGHARKHDKNTTKTIEWYLTRAEDEFGNGYDLTYKYAGQHQFQPLLEKIEYGTITVDLTWEARANKPDHNNSSKTTSYNDEYLAHRGGSTTLIRDRLALVNVQRANQSLRSYKLKYGVNNNRHSQLEEIEICALNNACKSSSFDWYEGIADFRQAESIGDFTSKNSTQKAQFLDVNGDGFTDIMYPSSTGSWKVRLGSADGYGADINIGRSLGSGDYADFATPIKLGLDHIQGLMVATSTIADINTGEGGAFSCVKDEKFYMYTTAEEAFADTNEKTLACGKISGGTLQVTSILQWYVIHLEFDGDTYTGSKVESLMQTFGNRLYPVDINNDGHQDLVVKYEYELVDYYYRKVGLVDSADGELLSVYIAEVENTSQTTSHIKFSEYMVKDPQITNDFDGPLSFVDFNNDGVLDLEKCSLATQSNACKRYYLDFDFDKHAAVMACDKGIADPLCDPSVSNDDVISVAVHNSSQPANKLTKTTTAADAVNGNDISKVLYSPYYYADFNGDGLTDRMILTTAGMVTYFSLGDGSEYDSVINTEVAGDPFKVQLLDFNGDGLTDVLAEDNSGLQLFQANRVAKSGNNSRTISYEKIEIFTSAELSDGLVKETNLSSAAVSIVPSQPSSWFQSIIFHNSFMGFNYGGSSINIGSITINSISNGIKFFSKVKVWQPPAIQYRNAPFIMDYNGDGISDILFFEDNRLFVSTRHNFEVVGGVADFANTNKVKTVVDSFANTTDFIYKNSQLSPNTDYDSVRFPYVNIANTTGVVASMKSGNAINGYRTQSYEFSGAQYHLQGRGFMGYGKRTITDIEKGISSEEVFRQQFPYTGALESSQSYQTADPTKKLAKTENSWLQKTLSFNTQTIMPYLQKVSSWNYGLTGAATSYSLMTQSFDDFGNLTGKTTYLGDGYKTSSTVLTSYLAKVSESYTYQHGSGSYVQSELDNWRISVPNQSIITQSNGSDSKSIVTRFTLKGDSHLVETKNDFHSTDQQLDHSYTYDFNGQLLTETVSSTAGDHTIASRTIFTNSNFKHGYLPQTIENATNHTASVEYHNVWHQPTKQTSVQGLTQTIEYDNWGNAYKTTSPDGAISLSLSNYCAISCPSGAYYYSTQLQMHKSQKGLLAPPQVTYFDALGRAIREESKNANKVNIYQDYEYDGFGRLTQASLPYEQGTNSADIKWVTYDDYDLFDRNLKISYPDGGMVNNTFSANYSFVSHAKTITNVLPGATTEQQVTITKVNPLGQTIEVLNRQSNLKNTYGYDAQGNLKTANIYDGTTLKKSVSAGYNIAGLKTQINDPDTGIYNYEYDALGLMRKQSDSRGNEYLYSYDKLNQKHTQTLNGQLDATWKYSDLIPGLLTQRFKTDFVESYEYDNLHRIKQVNTSLKSLAQRQFKYQYDAAGRMLKNTYPSGFEVEAIYNGLGFLTAYQNPASKHTYWQAQTMDAFGNWVGERLGNDIETLRTYEAASGLLATIKSTNAGEITGSGNVQNLDYTWDSQGNLRKRTDANLNVSETFNYDGVNRLLNATTTGLTSGGRTLSYAYDALGNMTYKSDLSDTNGMAYGIQTGTGINTGPSRLISVTKGGSILHSYRYDANGNMTQRGNVNMNYTAANKPSRIWTGSPQVAGFIENSFLYDTDEQRFYQQQKQGFNTVRETYYFGAGYEEIFDTDPDTQIKTHKQKAYVGGVMIHSFTQSNIIVGGGKITDIQYLHHDHLGSTNVITKSNGDVAQKLAFDPFGKARQGNWEDAITTPNKNPDWASITLNHTSTGFTGHEMLADFDLIHMGGRLYDPIAGRMMSADPFIQAPYFGQSYNRYSYVWNNPLSMTDPTGYYADISIVALPPIDLTPTPNPAIALQSDFDKAPYIPPYIAPLKIPSSSVPNSPNSTPSPNVPNSPNSTPSPNVPNSPNSTPSPSVPNSPSPVTELSKSESILSKVEIGNNLSGGLAHLGVGATGVGVLTHNHQQLQSSGLLLLSDGRVRSSRYYGNQYDSPLYVDAAKQYQQKIASLSVGAGMLGNALTTASIVTDSYKYSKGDISTERFLFNSTGNGWALGLAFTGSGLTAGLVGLGFYGASLVHDYILEPIARKVVEFNYAFERTLINAEDFEGMFYER